MTTSGWIGVDFDRTLAFFDGSYTAGRFGDPIPKMMDRVKAWLAEGIEVRIVTARACDPDECVKVQDWLERHGLPRLKVTNMKDFAMIELWDDAAVRVVRNTGEPCCNNDPSPPKASPRSSSSLGNEFPKQQARLRELLLQYREIGIPGAFGLIAIKAVLLEADEAAISGDPVRQLVAFKKMQECK